MARAAARRVVLYEGPLFLPGNHNILVISYVTVPSG